MENQFEFSPRLKKISFGLMAVGIIALIIGVIGVFGAQGDEAHHIASNRLWSNILINGFFFFGLSIIGTFFLSIQYAAEAAWATTLKRILEAVSSYVPMGGVVLILVFAAGSLHFHHLYHWMDPEVFDVDSPKYDAIIAAKEAYLNLPFFWFRTLLYLGVWTFFTHRFRKRSLLEDQEGGTNLHFNNVRDAAIFLVFFGYTSSTASWDWIMSIDTHWYSTLFGWYVLSGMWISSLVVVSLLIIYLQSIGKLKSINANHMHDLGKWIFAISFLWTYLFFSQFMLIWYSNIPEETTYFIARITEYPILYWGMFASNFLVPMLFLMDRDNKRNKTFVVVVGLIVLIGHWMDTYLLITPGTMKDHSHIGFLEIGMALGFVGMFSYVVLNSLANRPLMVEKHPYLNESLHHEIH
jgi:hypothetical protein